MVDSTAWPDGYRCAVVLTVDYNDIHGILTQAPEVAGRDKTLSVWRYGSQRGVDRLLGLFAELGVTSSWCIPGIVAEENPEHIRAIQAGGHEIACAGYRHQNYDNLSLAEQSAEIAKGCEALTTLTGQRPTGFRIPAGNGAPGFIEALRDQGIRWSSSWRGDDLPFSHPTAPEVIELPLHYELEDEPYFAFNLSPAVPPAQSRIASYSHTLGNLQMDFAGFHRFGLCYVLRLHPEIIATPGRIGVLRELLEGIQQHNDVWIATAGEVSKWWADSAAAVAEDHPAAVYERHYRDYGV
ncbi:MULTISPECIES: polysaccharide deacetylase family protein [unclassified Pseudomonas]|jgi:peptidoglycan/xylan/chitin deacetylase (PgdA/CDA1 family)|uniref:polysaccharide deacetylase family protein n=1 Tax=unclassified Pseudomonas TaxID=196821 RepID=UPI0019132C65|nr:MULTISPECIES: polysaccharide deacetylase [unclassified Pseudomonas]MBK5548808.1 polysaccharide deacetylase [Pseudomonas sp. TH03]MEB0228631.1 polysaccharide deacetylase [Pseudomonas sp. 5S1]MEB0294543.1 polysaccharide deacetylase [Pseudomonas sp. 10S4]WPX17131.1 polysaccharide deacetylase [Pseudomonas sp. 10S4]